MCVCVCVCRCAYICVCVYLCLSCPLTSAERSGKSLVPFATFTFSFSFSFTASSFVFFEELFVVLLVSPSLWRTSATCTLFLCGGIADDDADRNGGDAVNPADAADDADADGLVGGMTAGPP